MERFRRLPLNQGTALVGGECCQGVWKRSTDQRGFCSTDKREISSISSIRLDQRATDTLSWRNDRLGARHLEPGPYRK